MDPITLPEGGSLRVSLEQNNPPHFPIDFEWTMIETIPLNDTRRSFGYPFMTIRIIQRSDTGTYTLRATYMTPDDMNGTVMNGTFMLNVFGKNNLAYIFLMAIFIICTGMISPPNNTIIIRQLGDAVTIRCKLYDSNNEQQLTMWNIALYGPERRLIDINNTGIDFEYEGTPRIGLIASFRDVLIISEFTEQLDGAILYCGYGENIAFGHYPLKLYSKWTP